MPAILVKSPRREIEGQNRKKETKGKNFRSTETANKRKMDNDIKRDKIKKGILEKGNKS